MADPNQERVWFAREVMGLFVKAFTNLKLYPHDHKHVTSAIGEFSARLRSFVKMHQVLRFKITQDNMTVEDQPVYEAENRNENLAFRLYVDGLREISIALGVTDEEASGLANVFYTAITDQESDSTLLMWEADFRNIDHVAINSLTDAWESPDYFSTDQLDVLKQMNRDVDSIVESLTANAGRGTYAFELTDGAREMETANEIDDDTGERDEDEDGIFDVADDAIQTFRQDAMTWGPDRLLRCLVEHSMDGLALMPDVIGRDTIKWLVVEASNLSLRSRDMDLLGDLLNRFDGEAQLLDDDDPNAAIFQAPLTYLGRPENVERMIRLAKGDSLGGPKAYTRILSLLGKPGMLMAASTYRVAERKELLDALTDYMREHVELDPQALHLLVKEDMDGETVKTALFVANNRVKGAELAALLEVARAHPDPDIQKYANHLWRTNTNQGRVNATVDALKSDIRNDRVKALQALVRGNHTEAVDVLKDVIDGADFLLKDTHERKAYIDAYRFLGGTRAIAFLEAQSKRHTRIFNRRAAKEVREFAAKALDDLRRSRQ